MQTSIYNREPRPCILARLACTKCGPVRMALAPQDEPITSLECPYCFGEAKAQQIGTGRTLRPLPYFELEASVYLHLQDTYRRPVDNPRFVRLVPGQLVVYCEETSIIHFACVGDVHTNEANLSPQGVPSITFHIQGEDTPPVPHISGAHDCPPWWCLPDELTIMNAKKKPRAGRVKDIPPDAKRPRGRAMMRRREDLAT